MAQVTLDFLGQIGYTLGSGLLRWGGSIPSLRKRKYFKKNDRMVQLTLDIFTVLGYSNNMMRVESSG